MCDSNHTPSVIDRLPRTVELILSSTSSNELIFKNATPPYEEALKKSGYNVNLIINLKLPRLKIENANVILYGLTLHSVRM